MLICEGYMMFKGVMKIKRVNGNYEYVEGIWLYKPDCECWYCNGSSYPKDNCSVLVDNTK